MVFNSYSQLYKFVDNILTSNNNFSSLDIKICQKKKYLPLLLSGNLPLVVYLLILIILHLYHTNIV